MIKISQNQSKILDLFLENKSLSSSEIFNKLLELGYDISQVTIKRELTELKTQELLDLSGAGRSVVYSISPKGRLFTTVNAHEYSNIEPGQQKVDIVELQRFAKLYGKDINYFIK